MNRLSSSDIKRLVDAALKSGIHSPRKLLLKGIPAGWNLEENNRPCLQLELDLDALSQPVCDGVVDPLMIWLQNAADRAFPRQEYEVFVEYLQQLRVHESPIDAQVGRARSLAAAMRAFRKTGGGVIRVSAGFSSLAIPNVNAHPHPDVADALQDERRAMEELLDAGTFSLRALLHPGPWAKDPQPTPERIDRRTRWLAYMKELRTILRAQVGSPKSTARERRAFAGWKLDVVYWDDRPHHNLILLGEHDRFAGLRLKRGGGYTRTSRVQDRAFVREEAEDFDLLFFRALARAANGTKAKTPASALRVARHRLLDRLESDVKKMRKWLANVEGHQERPSPRR